MWGLFCHLRSHRTKPNSVCGFFSLRSNQLPLAAVQMEARSKKLSSHLLRRVQGISPKGPKRLPSLCEQLLNEDQKKLLVPARRSPRLGRIPEISTGCVERVWPLWCLQQDHLYTLFPRGTLSVYLRPFGSLNTKSRWRRGSCKEYRRFRGKS